MGYNFRVRSQDVEKTVKNVHKKIHLLFPEPLNLDFRINYVAGCNFAIVNFGGVGIYRSKPFDKIYISVDPFRPGNQVTTPFSPRIITARLIKYIKQYLSFVISV